MKRLIIAVLPLVIFSVPVHAQYYYKDIIINRQIAADMAAYREAKVHSIKINSFEGDGEASEDFFCEKKISRDFKKTELYTRTGISGSSLLETYFNAKGQPERTYDSSGIAVGITSYYYDGSGRLSRIVSNMKSSDDDFESVLDDEHIYEYNDKDVPLKMLRIKNKRDTTIILFSLDEHGNVGIEKDTRTAAKYYYYHNAAQKLTDVVHANEFRKNLVADYIFEYNEAGQVTQMTMTEEGGDNYFIWKYSYENNLRSKERLFSKEGKLVGKVEYEYK